MRAHHAHTGSGRGSEILASVAKWSKNIHSKFQVCSYHRFKVISVLKPKFGICTKCPLFSDPDTYMYVYCVVKCSKCGIYLWSLSVKSATQIFHPSGELFNCSKYCSVYEQTIPWMLNKDQQNCMHSTRYDLSDNSGQQQHRMAASFKSKWKACDVFLCMEMVSIYNILSIEMVLLWIILELNSTVKGQTKALSLSNLPKAVLHKLTLVRPGLPCHIPTPWPSMVAVKLQ